MSLVSDLINESFLDLNAIAPGEGITAAEQADAFLRLNQRLASLSTEQVSVYTVAHQGFALGNTTDYTLGVGGTLNTAATPVRVTGASGASGVFRGSIEVVSFDELAARASNPRGVSAALPELVAADNAWPLINVRVHPPPSQLAATTLWLDYWTQLVQFAAVGSAVSLPPGFELMLVKLLAVDLYPQYARPGSTIDILAAEAQAAKASVVALYGSIQGKVAAPPAAAQ